MHKYYLGQVLIVGLGGFVGSSARFVVAGLVQRLFASGTFPFGTLAVNIVGCLFIGFFGGLMETRQILGPAQRLFLLVGVLGGFTTFSTFAYETLSLTQGMDFMKAAANVVGQVVLGMTAAWCGYVGAQYL